MKSNKAIEVIIFYLNRVACLKVYDNNNEQNRYKSRSEDYYFTILLAVGFYISLIANISVMLSPEILPPPDAWCVFFAFRSEILKDYFSGPFGMYNSFTAPLENGIFNLPKDFRSIINFLFSKRFWVSIIVVLFTFIYFYRNSFRYSLRPK